MGDIYHAFAQMLDLVETLDEDLLNKQPLTEGTNAISALVVHCCAVTEYWLGHVGLGRPSRGRSGSRPLARRVGVRSLAEQRSAGLTSRPTT